MNADLLLAVAAVSSLACLFLPIWKTSGVCVRHVCGSFADLLMLPVAGAYILTLVASAWVCIAVSWCASVAFPSLGKPFPPRPSTGSSLPSMT